MASTSTAWAAAFPLRGRSRHPRTAAANPTRPQPSDLVTRRPRTCRPAAEQPESHHHQQDSSDTSPPPPSTSADNFDDLARRLGLEYFATFLASLRLRGDWERDQIGQNFLLRPPADVPPKAVVHFLGGAFVGAAPHILYRYFLESLAANGYVVIATPYQLKFDYLETVDSVLESFDKLSVRLALDYGPLPIITIGHSAGALLHVISASLFQNADRAASVLISFNNKPVSDAIPLFSQAVTPLAEGTKSDTWRTVRDQTLKAAESAATAFQSFAGSQFAPPLIAKDLIPLANETLKVVEQVEPLIDDIADGRSEFVPTPDEVKMAAKASYATPNTLVVRFAVDPIDESPVAETILAERTLLSFKQIPGTHITPLNQDPFAFRFPFEECVERAAFLRDPLRTGVLRDVDLLAKTVIDWMDDGIQSGQI